MPKSFAKIVANLITQTGFKLMKRYKCNITELGISVQEVAGIAHLIKQEIITMNTGYQLFEKFVRKHYDK